MGVGKTLHKQCPRVSCHTEKSLLGCPSPQNLEPGHTPPSPYIFPDTSSSDNFHSRGSSPFHWAHTSRPAPRLKGDLVTGFLLGQGVCLVPFLGTEPRCKAVTWALGQPLLQRQGVGKDRSLGFENFCLQAFALPRKILQSRVLHLSLQKGQKNPFPSIPRNHSVGFSPVCFKCTAWACPHCGF